MDGSDIDTSMHDATDPDIQTRGMMDSMDDLFGDATDSLNNVSMPLPAPSLPPPSGVIQRIAELQTSGACTTLAWSNTGSIARISPDGLKVTFCVFVEDFKTGAWVPGKESPFPVHAPEGSRFVHVQFNALGHELAIVDDVGLVHLFIAPTGLGRTHVSATEFGFDRTGRSNSDALAGLHWLPIWPTDFRVPYVGPANKNNGTWGIQIKGRDAQAPRIHNPSDGKNAIAHVSRNGCLTLLYQQESGRWYSVHKELDHTGLSDELISHASFCEYGNQLLLVAYDEAKRFRVITISIDWNVSQHPRPTGGTSIRLNPSIEVGHLTGLEHVAAQHSDIARLTCLTLLPQVPDFAVDQTLPAPPSPPTIIATFTHTVLPSGTTQQIPESFTATSRWQLEDVNSIMHESFGKLRKNSSANVNLPAGKFLRRLPDQVTMKLVLSIKPMSFGTILAFVATDGSVEFRDRNAFNVIEPFMDTTFVSSLPQAGFEHTAGFHSIDAAISLDGAAMAYAQLDGKMDGKLMFFRHGWQNTENNGIVDGNGLIEEAVVCIARQHMLLTLNSAATAETLALLPPELSPELYRLFFQQLARPMTRAHDILSFDEGKKQMIMIKDPHIPRLLSAQLVLGTRPPSRTPSLPAQFAWAVLNLKHITMSLMTTTGHAEKIAALSSETVHSLRGLVKWTVDLFVFILEALVTTSRKMRDGTPAPKAIQDYISETKSPAFHLLLCSYSRTWLRWLATYLPRYFKVLSQKIPTSRALLEKQQLHELARLGETLPFKIDATHALIAATEKSVLESYSHANTPDRARSELELAMLTECNIPEQLHEALTTLMTTTLPKLTPDLELGKIYFWDTTWLHLQARATELPPRYDAMRKTPLKEGVKLRRCRRCNSAMEDLAITTEANRDLPTWLQVAQRQCVWRKERKTRWCDPSEAKRYQPFVRLGFE
ncbi:hypothetical protein Q7P37_001109 [Cladosporium fusiforme]